MRILGAGSVAVPAVDRLSIPDTEYSQSPWKVGDNLLEIVGYHLDPAPDKPGRIVFGNTAVGVLDAAAVACMDC